MTYQLRQQEKKIWFKYVNQNRSSSSTSLMMMQLYFNFKIKVEVIDRNLQYFLTCILNLALQVLKVA